MASRTEIRRPPPGATSGSIPRSALLLGGGTVGIALMILGAIIARGDGALAALEAAEAAGEDTSTEDASEEEAPPADRAPKDELAEAKAGGPAALEALAQRFPKDPAPLKALLHAHAGQASGQVAALSAARRLLALSPDAAGDDAVRTLVVAASGGPPEASSAAFDLMANRMGSRGPDLLYELALKSPSLKSRAMRTLGDQEVQGRATPALRIAYELRMATSCKARKALLDRAAQAGDQRAGAVLAPLIVSPGKGCGFLGLSRCPPPCAAIAADIRKTLAAIEARMDAPAGSASATAPRP